MNIDKAGGKKIINDFQQVLCTCQGFATQNLFRQHLFFNNIKKGKNEF